MMDSEDRRFTRRSALKAGAGIAGALLAFKEGTVPALARSTEAAHGTAQDTTLLAAAAQQDDSWSAIEQAMGNTKGTVESNGVFLIDLPRTDIRATIFGVPVKPDLALDGEVAFKRIGDRTVMKFEIPLLDTEVNPVLSAWLEQHTQPQNEAFTALHNHYLGDSPAIRYFHGFAAGEGVGLAHVLYTVLSHNSGTPFGHGDEPPGNPGFDAKRVTQIIGGTGTLTNGVLAVSVTRKEQFSERGIALPSEMLFNSTFNFQVIAGGQVAVIGEFVVLSNEADPVARSLRHRGHMVTALHSHELEVQPTAYYLHSWATGAAQQLAYDIRATLELTNSTFM